MGMKRHRGRLELESIARLQSLFSPDQILGEIRLTEGDLLKYIGANGRTERVKINKRAALLNREGIIGRAIRDLRSDPLRRRVDVPKSISPCQQVRLSSRKNAAAHAREIGIALKRSDQIRQPILVAWQCALIQK